MTVFLFSLLTTALLSEEELRFAYNSKQGVDISFKTIIDSLSQYGVAARTYKMDWDVLQDALTKGYAPILIHYDKPNPHFALLMHIEGDYLFAADGGNVYFVRGECGGIYILNQSYGKRTCAVYVWMA